MRQPRGKGRRKEMVLCWEAWFSVQNSAGFHLGLVFLAVFLKCWCPWFAGWWLEHFPLQALLSSSQIEGNGSCPWSPVPAPQFILHRSSYQRPLSPRQYFKLLLCYEKLFLVEGRPWLAAEQFPLLSSSCQQPNLISRAVLFFREPQVRHFPGVVPNWSERNSDTGENGMFLGVMDLSSLPG